MLLFFASEIYGHIDAKFGGGSPVQVRFFYRLSDPATNEKSVAGLLIDETQHGYYFLRSPEETKAHFVPRDAITEIDFSQSPFK